MPSGELLAPSLFTEHGVQSVRSTNEADKSENVVSKFLSQPARNYISGSEVSTMDIAVDISNTSTNTVADFRLPGNCDVISAISLSVFNNVNTGYDYANNLVNDQAFNGSEIFNMIQKIEVRIGNSIFQTIAGSDILSRQLTETPFSTLHANTIKHKVGVLDIYNINTGIFSGSGGYVNSFLQCGAPNQNMNIKVFFETDDAVVSKQTNTTEHTITARLEFMKHSLTSIEREYITNNIINSVVHSSESIGPFTATDGTDKSLLPASRQAIPTGFLGIQSNNLGKYVFNLNEFKINCSHIIISTHNKKAKIEGNSVNVLSDSRINLIEAQLKIGGSYHGGPYTAGFMRNQAKTILGLTAVNTVADSGIYVIPIGSYKFGSDSIPLSKVHNIQLELTLDYNLFDVDYYHETNLFITAVGTNVLTYSGGSVNIHF